MATCFVIQPFDGGKFDKRYEDIFSPAVSAAGLEPYRVDRDPGVSIPIEDIQSGIEASVACLADISTDNPNVWFELGYAIATRRELILVCSEERTSELPFDVHHRFIIKYSTESSSDFERLRAEIESRLKATLQRREKLGQVARIKSVAKLEGLDQHQVATLVSVAEAIEEPSGGISVDQIRRGMERAGFMPIATTLGLMTLLDNEMLESFEDTDYNGASFIAYRLGDRGRTWLLDNQERFTLKQEKRFTSDLEDVPF